MLIIEKNPMADSRTCDVEKVEKSKLIEASLSHIEDVKKCMRFFCHKLKQAGNNHDSDKLTDIDQFYHDFKTKFESTIWWDNHRKINRHHILQQDGIPDDVNLIDVFELIADCVTAGLARTGIVYDIEIDEHLLYIAFQNTVTLLKKQILVKDESLPLTGTPILARIEAHTDTGYQSWPEVIYHDGNNWKSYHGSTTFEDGEHVVEWQFINFKKDTYEV